MARPLLEIKNLKTYFFTRRGVVKAVDDVNFRLRSKEILGLVGESGCGKTITSLSILRLVPQPAGRIVGGEIIFDGEDLLKKSEKEMRQVRGRRISMILQDPMTSLNPLFTIGNQVKEALQAHGKVSRPEIIRQLKEKLSLVRIPSPEVVMGYYPHQCSGGMKQRVVGAIALSCQPHLLIADEPTTSLDVTIQAQYLRLLKDIQQRSHLAIIFITHDFGIVARMCDRVAVMYAGKIVEMAGVRELFNQPLHPYTVALMRSVPKVEAKEERLPTLEGQPPALYELPPGCSFAPRCAFAEKKCTISPPQVEMENERSVRCWRYEDAR
jgi:oligopeptide/dipeptide ABC transporter ATP-binding protein